MPQLPDPLLPLVVLIVSAHIEHNDTPAQSLPDLIRDVYSALAGVAADTGSRANRAGAMVVAGRKGPAGRAESDDHVICLECGSQMKILKRHLRAVHNATPAQYRAKYRLPADYPMVARQYAALRSNLAKESGLGRRQTPRRP